uniref:Sodium/solute symporter n=1 Tax=Anopheles merus TaxID=30066 RepID=A0A182VA30_ANOME
MEIARMASGRSTLAESLRELYQFSVVDYCMFGAMLMLSAACGIYFGFFKRNKGGDSETPESSSSDDESAHRTVTVASGSKRTKTTFGSSTMDEYLLGSRKLKAFPVAMSLVAGYISGVTILGTPAEIYNFGTQYWLIVIPILLMGVAVCTVYLPVFCSLKLNSSYEYLELRFSSSVRSIASVMFVIDELLFLPMIIYVPALAFNQVTGFNLYVIGAIVCVVCIFYTLLGGIKAVVFTDAWQVVVMFISVVVVVIIGTIAIGGPDVIWDRSVEGGRIDFFNFNPSMYERQTFWAVLIGGFFYWTSFNSVNQTMVQRYMSLPNLKKAKLSIAMFTVGMGVFVSVCCYAGLLLYGKYFECDPTSVGLVTTDDQLFPHYVMESVGKLKGIPGLFIAGVFGAALSSLSVVLNSTSAVLLEDILKGLFRVNPSPFVANVFVRGSVVVLGLAAMGCLFIIEKLGGILSVATSLSAIAAGTTCGIFTLGMLVPWSNTKGALFGGVSGALLSGWVSLGSQFAGAAGEIVPHKLPVSIDGCIEDLVTNVTMVNPVYPDESGVFPLYRLSYHWITPIGVTTVLIVGTIVSFLTGPRDLRHIDPELISPVIHRFLPQESFGNFGTASKNCGAVAPVIFCEEMQPHTNIASSSGTPYGTAVERNGQCALCRAEGSRAVPVKAGLAPCRQGECAIEGVVVPAIVRGNVLEMDSSRGTVLDSIRELYQFGVVDYCMFAAMLILSAACGIYFGFFKRTKAKDTPTATDTSDLDLGENPPTVGSVESKTPISPFGSSTIDEYLLGSRKLKAFPVAMSLVAGYISGVTILGTPAEIYNFGTQYWLIVVPIILTGIAVCTIYLPVFCSLKLNSSSTMSDSIREMYQFSVVDYCMFGGMLILSAACGIYYGFFKRSTNTSSSSSECEEEQDHLPEAGVPAKKPTNTFGSATIDEYLLGSRKLKAFPVAMSLLAGYISGVTILGTPAEIYNFGTQYWLIAVPILLMGVAVCTVYLPVFCSLKLNSSYEYLELRFNPYVRSMASVMFVINQMLFLPMVIYVPALAFNQVTGFNIYVIGAIVCVVCIFYTLLGGIKAVVFTDAWQVVVMFISVVVVVIIGTIALGGPGVIWDRAVEGGRIDFFNFSPSMYERQTFWAVLIGGFFYWTSYNAVNQTMVQRYMSLPNLKTAKFSIYMFVVGTAIFVSVCCYTGLLLYGKYYDCDPATVGLVTTSDQLFPHYVMESVGNLRGMPGLFIAGVFGAALSSLSVILNTTSGVLLEDILKGLFRVTPSSLVANIVVRSSVVVLGLAAMGCLFIVDKLDGILIVSATLAAIGNGTTGGIFTLGMLVPWSNTKGALAGGIAGALLSGWISLGSQFASAAGEVVPHKLPVSVDGCIAELITNTTIVNPIYPDESGVFPLYRLSYHWITPIGVTTVVLVGSIVSFLTGPRDLRYIDPELISPVVHRFLPRESFSYFGTANKGPTCVSEEMQTQTNIPVDSGAPYGTAANGQNGRVKAHN